MAENIIALTESAAAEALNGDMAAAAAIMNGHDVAMDTAVPVVEAEVPADPIVTTKAPEATSAEQIVLAAAAAEASYEEGEINSSEEDEEEEDLLADDDTNPPVSLQPLSNQKVVVPQTHIETMTLEAATSYNTQNDLPFTHNIMDSQAKLQQLPPKQPHSHFDGEDQELEAIRKRVKEMEEEAQRLKEMQNEVDLAMQPQAMNPETVGALQVLGGASVAFPSLEEKIEADARSIYVGQVEYNATAEDVEAHFRGCGAVNRVTIICDKFSGHPKGFGYIEFADKESVETAMALDGSLLKGRSIKVSPKRTNKPGITISDRARARARGRGRGFRGRGIGPMRGGMRGRGLRQAFQPY